MPTVLSPPTSLWCADGLSASIDGPGLQRIYQFDKPFVLVGSSARCDIVLPLFEAPPVALYLHVTDEAICWLDLSTPAAQWRSGAFAATGCLVWRGYHLALERVAAAPREHLTGDGKEPLSLPDDRPADVPVFDIEFDGERLARAKLTSAMTLVGQSQRCRLRLRNRHVSNDHCLFYVSNRHAWVVDLLSEEGVFVRGQRVAVSPVLAGDAVTIGKAHMTLVRWSHRKASLHEPEAAADSAIAISGDTEATLVLDERPQAAAASATDTDFDESVITELSPAQPVSRRGFALADTTIDAASLRDTILEPPAPCESPTADPRPLTPLLPPPLPDPSLDRLIVRHKQNYRRAIFRWSIASSVILAAFLSAVVWAVRNLEFDDTEPALDFEPNRPAAVETPAHQKQNSTHAQPGFGGESTYPRPSES